MKSFELKMLDSGGLDGKVAAQVRGQGDDPVEFDTVDIEYETTLELRKHCARETGAALSDDGSMDNVVAVGLLFEVAVHLVKETIVPRLNNEQATRLINLTGGIRGELVPQLAIKYGISDLMLNRDDGGDEDELPM